MVVVVVIVVVAAAVAVGVIVVVNLKGLAGVNLKGTLLYHSKRDQFV